ncbi:hypothetical protein TRP66_18340 [Pseudomonas sp. JDS28PS106]|uniref:hypothetical protein n=1 Tax=Pseudomonas sp. JDS28PS106 TaxID=2497235 RepID=UPI002FD01B25
MKIHKGAREKRQSDILKVESRAKLVKLALQVVKEQKRIFKYKKHLLQDIARFVEEAEELSLREALLGSGLELEEKTVRVVVSGFYKSKTYSAIVDEWILDNPDSIINKGRQKHGSDAKLRLECSELSNECARLSSELIEVQDRLLSFEHCQGKAPSNYAKYDLYNAYFAIDALIGEFGVFLKIDAGGVILDNVLQRNLIPMSVIKGYLEWKKREIKE